MKPTPNKQKMAINWKQVRKRLDQATAATEAALRLSPERARQVLEERAQVLARAPTQAPLASEVLEVATFNLAQEHYAIETRYIREVVRLADYTPIPGAPNFLVGVINLRGEILAVIDLRKVLSIQEKGLTDLARVLVLGGERAEFGIQADAVHEVRILRTDEILEPPGSAAGVGREFLRGVTNDTLIVLDGSALLQDRRLFVDHDEEPATAQPASRGEKP
jgi:purine-binding chemotaxis protein CheW